MKTVHVAALAATLAAASISAAARPTIQVIHPWIALPPSGAPTAAGYAVLQNTGKTADAFVGAESPAAQMLELHAMSMAGGVMRMRQPLGGVAVAPGQSLTLAPGGDYHFMFVRPKRPLRAGEWVPVTLRFAKAGRVKTMFVVKAASGTGMTMR